MIIPKARRLPSGSWFIQLRLGGHSIPISARTERDCIRQAQLTKAEYLAGRQKAHKQSPKALTLHQAIDLFINQRMNTLSPVTIRGYRTIQRNRFQSVMQTPIDEIDNWQELCDIEARHCSPKTVKNSAGLIRTVLSVNGISMPKVTLPKPIGKEIKFLEPEEVPVFLQAIKGTEIEAAAMLALHSLRRSELLALEKKNIDLKNKTIHVSGALVPNEHNQMVERKQNKTQLSYRTIPFMIPGMERVLQNLPSHGKIVQISPHTLRKRINRICRENNLPEVGIHGLRHTFASMCFHRGIPEELVMEFGGWSNLSTVRNIYTHLAKTDRARHTEAMRRLYF